MRKERRKESGGRTEGRGREREKEKNTKAMGRGYIIPASGPSAFAFENKMRKHGPSLDPSSTRALRGQGRRRGARGAGALGWCSDQRRRRRCRNRRRCNIRRRSCELQPVKGPRPRGRISSANSTNDRS
ncbi:hypothetical protein X777_08578 [Ooceraea biroi]|uniref:Uncharacterized protein n=1 Tax=Ooceraea biroi TaxID=2015173 RepID=A0A026W8Q0_OOCBI|nr:hypothetical protein X777_08578 [Ooceraea biroi]